MERICKICGKTFMPRDPRHLCCSTECSKENKRRNNRAWCAAKKAKTPKPSRICKICGKTFTPCDNAQKCCSTECSKENNRRLVTQYNNKHKILTVAVPKKFQGRIVTCQSCGRKFKQTFNREKFCSDQCRTEFWKHYGLKTAQEAVSL